MRFAGILVLAFVSLGTTKSHAQFLPSLPSLESVSVGAGAAHTASSNTWHNPDGILSLDIEVSLLGAKWPKEATKDKYNGPYQAVVVYAGTYVGSAGGRLTESLTADTMLRDSYIGGRYQYHWCTCFGVYAGADIRLTSFDSGRVYENDPARTAYKLSGNGGGAEVSVGVAIAKYFFIEANVVGRYWPSIVIDPPSGGTLPASAPTSVRFLSIGGTAGLMFTFGDHTPPKR